MASFLKRLFGKGGENAGGSGGSPEGGLDHAAVMARAENELQLKTGVQERLFQIGSAAWSVDLSAGTITFEAPGAPRASAPVQVVGTLDTSDGSWLWGWDHPSVPEHCARSAAAVRDYGAARGIDELTTQRIACDEAKAWGFAALAAHLSGDQGAYRGPSGQTLVFMTFGTVTLSGDDARETPPTEDFAAGLPPVDAPDVLDFVQTYCRAIAAIEAAHYAMSEDERDADFLKAIADMDRLYERDWRRGDDYHRPAGLSSQSEFDLALTRDWRVHSRAPGRYRVTYVRVIPHLTSPRAFDVERFPDGLKIVDHLF